MCEKLRSPRSQRLEAPREEIHGGRILYRSLDTSWPRVSIKDIAFNDVHCFITLSITMTLDRDDLMICHDIVIMQFGYDTYDNHGRHWHSCGRCGHSGLCRDPVHHELLISNECKQGRNMFDSILKRKKHNSPVGTLDG